MGVLQQSRSSRYPGGFVVEERHFPPGRVFSVHSGRSGSQPNHEQSQSQRNLNIALFLCRYITQHTHNHQDKHRLDHRILLLVTLPRLLNAPIPFPARCIGSNNRSNGGVQSPVNLTTSLLFVRGEVGATNYILRIKINRPISKYHEAPLGGTGAGGINGGEG